MTTKRILITGGFGFIGSHLIEALLQKSDASIHVVDNLVTSPIDVLEYLAQLPDAARVTYDLCSIKEFMAAATSRQFDEIYHLAAVVGPVGVLRHAGEILRQTVDDTYAVADFAARAGARMCDISTSEVYGGGRDGYCSENDSKIITSRISPRLEYAVAKLAAEIALVNKVRADELHCTIVRPFNVAGPRQATGGGFVLPRFIRQALVDEDLTVYGDGSMVRAFTHVRDIADGIMRTMSYGDSGTAYNMGNPSNKITILSLAERVVSVLKSKSRIVFIDPKTLWGDTFEEASDKYPDADRAKAALQWDPVYHVDEIIADTAAYISAGRRD